MFEIPVKQIFYINVMLICYLSYIFCRNMEYVYLFEYIYFRSSKMLLQKDISELQSIRDVHLVSVVSAHFGGSGKR